MVSGEEAPESEIRADSHYTLRFRSIRFVCVHTVRRVQSPSGTARERSPALFQTMQPLSFSKRQQQ